MLKVIFYLTVLIWAAGTLPKSWLAYKETREKIELLEVAGRALLIPGAAIAIIDEIIGLLAN